ncbi:mechanosensitive channel of small conductance-like 6 [Prunus dulcis]|uniref:Mechanosensitive channel of small conductance-like 6 n=1 Tax=Prunus dulcis TaxID=3755 RepID=A0A5H2XVV1_PRUDU|nr:mechanosensitive channel of small conductance-like 6 [Prunus dulcis]
MRQMNENWRKETRANYVVILEHEIDRYITDPIEDVVDLFDVLKWWKLNEVKYPSLTYCKDVLAIPVSTIYEFIHTSQVCPSYFSIGIVCNIIQFLADL